MYQKDAAEVAETVNHHIIFTKNRKNKITMEAKAFYCKPVFALSCIGKGKKTEKKKTEKKNHAITIHLKVFTTKQAYLQDSSLSFIRMSIGMLSPVRLP